LEDWIEIRGPLQGSDCRSPDPSTHAAAVIKGFCKLPLILARYGVTDSTALVRSLRTDGETIWIARVCLDENSVGEANNVVRSSGFGSGGARAVRGQDRAVAVGMKPIPVVDFAWSRD